MKLPSLTAGGASRSRLWRRGILAAAAAAAALTLSSCETATPYQPISSVSPSRGGYAERQLSPGVWQVMFSGNTLTSRETVEGYLLYRAAELTLQQGFDWFEVVNRNTEHNVREEPVPSFGYDPWYGYSYWRPYWSYYYPRFGWRTWDPFWDQPFFDTQRVEQYQATAQIEMHRGAVPANDRQVFDARQVIARLGPSIRRPGP